MREEVLQTGPDADPHNYVVLGGMTHEWAMSALKRFTRINVFGANFELFWIKMPNSTPALTILKELAEKDGSSLKPKVDTEMEFTVENARKAFDTLRGRRTAGKIVLNVVK
jgi:NADPH:quinone reductase-like Zn-dependent oxidoreductase